MLENITRLKCPEGSSYCPRVTGICYQTGIAQYDALLQSTWAPRHRQPAASARPWRTGCGRRRRGPAAHPGSSRYRTAFPAPAADSGGPGRPHGCGLADRAGSALREPKRRRGADPADTGISPARDGSVERRRRGRLGPLARPGKAGRCGGCTHRGRTGPGLGSRHRQQERPRAPSPRLNGVPPTTAPRIGAAAAARPYWVRRSHARRPLHGSAPARQLWSRGRGGGARGGPRRRRCSPPPQRPVPRRPARPRGP